MTGKGQHFVCSAVDHAFATEGVTEEVVAALGKTEATFRELGADISEVTVPALDHMSEAFLVLCSTEAAAAHKETYPEYASEYGNVSMRPIGVADLSVVSKLQMWLT